MTNRRLESRVHRRGVALVEASVIIPGLIVCFGAMMWAGGLRYRKQEQQQLARQVLFTYATHGCTGSSAFPVTNAPSNVAELNAKPGPTGDGRATGAMQSALSDPEVARVSKHFGTASGGPPVFMYSRSMAYVSGTRPVTGHSFYFCNEVPEHGVFGFFKYVVNAIGNFLP